LAEKGENGKKDMRRAAKYYKMAADKGNREGQYYFAMCCESGDGVKKDLEAALKYYQMAARQGHSHAPEKVKRLTKASSEKHA
jgi:TPR repeat protein